MKQPIHPWRDVGLPIAVSMGLFCVLNFCWNAPFPKIEFYRIVPAQVGVYLVVSLVALPFLARAMSRGMLSVRDLGLGPDGWQVSRRLLGLGLAIGLTAMMLLTQNVPPEFGDYCFWFFFLLPATMVEMLVFVCLAFCLPRRWLLERGWRPAPAALLPGLFAGVTFGLYHYTHEEQWHQFALQLIPVMWFNLACFVLTRNFHLTLIVHNVVAAQGFVQAQYEKSPPEHDMDPSTYLHDPRMMTVLIVTFVVPYVLWHVQEWRYWPREPQPTVT